MAHGHSYTKQSCQVLHMATPNSSFEYVSVQWGYFGLASAGAVSFGSWKIVVCEFPQNKTWDLEWQLSGRARVDVLWYMDAPTKESENKVWPVQGHHGLDKQCQ